MTLPGLEIAVGTKRVYPRSTLAAQVIGYIGAIPSQSKWKELEAKGYKYSDTIGLDGIEASMEDWLTQDNDARQGYKIVERDSVGKITRELSYVEPQDGNNVKLTIYASYQQQAERALAENVAKTRETQETKLMLNSWLESNKTDIESRNWTKYPLSLADRAAMMVIDMQGRVLAMANYPTYDLNALVRGGERAENPLRRPQPLMNYNIHARATPGSIFKMVSSLGALMEGELMPDETISDGGLFMLYTSDPDTAPKCWISASQRYKHQYQTSCRAFPTAATISSIPWAHAWAKRGCTSTPPSSASPARPASICPASSAASWAARRAFTTPTRRWTKLRRIRPCPSSCSTRLRSTLKTRVPSATSPTTTSTSTAASSASWIWRSTPTRPTGSFPCARS
jgi:hypothetical protein